MPPLPLPHGLAAPRGPQPSTKPPKIAEHSQIPDHLLAGAVYSFEQARIQAKAVLTKAIGNLSTEKLEIPRDFTGWAFYNESPVTAGRTVTSLYVAGVEAARFVYNALGILSFAQTGSLGANNSIGTSTDPWPFGYFGTLDLTTDLLLGTGGITFDDATTQTTAAVTGAPTTADYLVGTANGDLSAEIVVGTSPGGEIGGTWASPTVDTLHASSYHPLTKIQATIQTLDTTSLTASDTMTQTVGTNEVWLIESYIFVTDTSFATEGIVWDWDGPTGFGGAYSWEFYEHANSSTGASATLLGASYVSSPGTDQGGFTPTQTSSTLHMSGRLTTGATEGSLTWRFAKSFDAGTDTLGVRVGSNTTFTRIS